jgi:hypothetical protein
MVGRQLDRYTGARIQYKMNHITVSQKGLASALMPKPVIAD